jgi:hypothetical protein
VALVARWGLEIGRVLEMGQAALVGPEVVPSLRFVGSVRMAPDRVGALAVEKLAGPDVPGFDGYLLL